MSFSSGESVLAMLSLDYLRALSVLPSPLWGGVGGGGRCVRQRSCVTASTPPRPFGPTLPTGWRVKTEFSARADSNSHECALPFTFLRHHRFDAARECPRGAGRNAQAAARQARRDVGGAQPLAVDGLLARIGHACLQVFARAD